jgi:Ca-activated chloride channel family protein
LVEDPAVKFAVVQWLWWLLALPPAFFFVLADERRRQKQVERFANRAVWRSLIPELDPRARTRKMAVWLLAVGFVLIALARPQWGTHEESSKSSGLDIMVALDVSNSMEVEDVVPSRIKKARHLLKSLSEKLQGDRLGLVAFAASSYVACPLTTDTDYFLETLQIINPRMVSNQGTDLGIGLDTARKALERGAEELTEAGSGSAPPSAAQQASRVVILISDGEDQEAGAIKAAKALKETGIRLFVLGVGTEKGGPVPVRDDAGNLVTYKKDRRGQPVVSGFKPNALVSLASAGGGQYWNVTTEETEIGEMLSQMGALSRGDYAERRYVVYEDRFQFPLALAVLLLLIEISLPVRKVRAEKGKSPRNATTVSAATGKSPLARTVEAAKSQSPSAPIVLLVAALSLSARPAQAEGLDTYLRNESGLKAYKAGKYSDAQREFGEAQARDPRTPALQFNQGVVQMHQGDSDSAARFFADAAQGAAEKGDKRLRSESTFNLGLALDKKGDSRSAARAFLDSIVAAQEAQDPQLEEEARKQLELLHRKKKQQKQQEKQDQQNKDGKDPPKDPKDQKDQSGKPQDGKGKPDDKPNQKDKEGDKSKQGEKEGQPKHYQDPSKGRKRSFSSGKLSNEDAERVMSELSNKERDLQTKLKKQRGNAQASPNEKDW